MRQNSWRSLSELRTGNGHELPSRLRRELKREFKRLDLVLEQIAVVEAERDAAVTAPVPEDADAEKVAFVARPGGLGTEAATILMHEALFRPFATRKEVAAYAGLTSVPFDSGQRQRDQGISKAGNPLLRKTMIELAGRGCATSPRARWRAGYTSGSVLLVAAFVQSLPLRLSENFWWPCMSPPASCRRERGSRLSDKGWAVATA